VKDGLQEAPLLFDEMQLSQTLGFHDSRTLASFYDLFLQQSRPLLEVLQAGAGRQGDQTLEKLAHKLKSSSVSVGAQPLGAMLGRIEALCRAGDLEALAIVIPQAHRLAAQTFAAIDAFRIRLAGDAEPVPPQSD